MRQIGWMTLLSLLVTGGAALVFFLYVQRQPETPQPENHPAASGVVALIEKLKPLHSNLRPPHRGDWLAEHKEPGQTYQEYINSSPQTAKGDRRVIYIQPLGDFSDTQRRIVNLTSDFMSKYFALPVKVREDWPLSKIPDTAQRVHPTWGDKQILSTYVIDDVLAPNLPADAAAMIAFTATDLWPGQGWNFVFGQASLQKRVGVWSIYRNGDAAKSDADFRLCLLRTIKTATHETGHMFSMYHCTAYECNMCGANSRDESDRKPLEVCPECVAKIWYATDADALKRFRELESFCTTHGLKDETEFYKRSADAIGNAQPAN